MTAIFSEDDMAASLFKTTQGFLCLISQFIISVLLLLLVRFPIEILAFGYFNSFAGTPSTGKVLGFSLFFGALYVVVCFLIALVINIFWAQYFKMTRKSWIIYLSLLQLIFAPFLFWFLLRSLL